MHKFNMGRHRHSKRQLGAFVHKKVVCHAIDCLLHPFAVTNAENMVETWPQLAKRDALNDV